MNILRSLKFAVKGIIYAIKNERNMRIHTVAMVYVVIFSLFFSMNLTKYLILTLIIGLVMMAEMFNSSIENLIDLCSKDYNSTAKAAKDIAAGGVLIVCISAFISGIFLFSEISAYVRMWVFFSSYPIFILLLIFFSFLSYLYIFLGPVEIKNRLKTIINKIKKRQFKIFGRKSIFK